MRSKPLCVQVQGHELWHQTMSSIGAASKAIALAPAPSSADMHPRPREHRYTALIPIDHHTFDISSSTPVQRCEDAHGERSPDRYINPSMAALSLSTSSSQAHSSPKTSIMAASRYQQALALLSWQRSIHRMRAGEQANPSFPCAQGQRDSPREQHEMTSSACGAHRH
jgi:hypothetical protein